MPLFLFVSAALIWGSTWYVILLQLGQVDPMASVTWRFLLAAAILFSWCLWRAERLRFGWRDHGWFALLGACLFGVNYWLFYEMELLVTSAYGAVAFSLVIGMNALHARIFLGKPLEWGAIAGGSVGVVGVAFIFWQELSLSWDQPQAWLAIALGVAATWFASLGNIIGTYCQSKGYSLNSVNAFAMLYGAVIVGAIALISGREFAFVWSVQYVGSLLYLAVFGSVLGFYVYLRLLHLVGPTRGGFVALFIPIVAMGVSIVFEAYRPDLFAALGIVLILLGNVAVLKRRQTK